MKTHGLTIKLIAKKPKNARNCESRVNISEIHREALPVRDHSKRVASEWKVGFEAWVTGLYR
jgi:hypothetical protein